MVVIIFTDDFAERWDAGKVSVCGRGNSWGEGRLKLREDGGGGGKGEGEG